MRALLALPLLLAGCGPDETISGYVDRDAAWRLVELDGAPFVARATVRFPAQGEVTGDGPCNGFRATQTAPYPWFELDAVAATRRACPALAAEGRFLAALEAMTLAEATDRLLILSNGAGREMVFERE